MSVNLKKTAIGLLIGAGLFWLVTKVFSKSTDDTAAVKQIPITDENIDVAVSAYKEAIGQNEDKQTLDAMNDTFKKDFGLTVTVQEDGNTIIVRNMAGNNIRTI